MKKIAGNPYLTIENGKLFINSVYFEDFLKVSDTPIMIFLENRIRDNIKRFKNIFSSVFNNFHCFYSFKANYLPEICNIIISEGLGAEIIGLPELKLAIKLKLPGNKILVGGPFLPKDLIEKSIEYKVKEIIVYNLNNIYEINSIAHKFNIIQDICIRVNSQKYNSRLGITFNENNLNSLQEIIRTCKNIKITTILSHYGTQMNNIEQFKKNVKAIAESLKKITNIGLNIENINLGGGFPEASVMPLAQLKEIALEIKKIINDFKIDYKKIYFEPGRYFMGDTGIFISEIINVSEDRWAFLNIGNHICPKFARCSLRFYNASEIDEPHKYKTSFAGIVPTDQDVLIKDYFFTEKLNKGDKILVTNVGAYCLTFSNRFPYSLPKIFLVKDRYFKQIFNPSNNKDFSLS